MKNSWDHGFGKDHCRVKLKENTPQTIYSPSRLSFSGSWLGLLNLAGGREPEQYSRDIFINQNEQGKQGVLQKN